MCIEILQHLFEMRTAASTVKNDHMRNGSELGQFLAGVQHQEGAGGQGEVWRAHDGTRGVDIALKVVTPAPGREEEAWAALQHEYAIASKLEHRSILKVFAPEKTGDVMVLPMELASGGDLRRLRGGGFLEIIPVLLEIAQALEHAHERSRVARGPVVEAERDIAPRRPMSVGNQTAASAAGDAVPHLPGCRHFRR